MADVYMRVDRNAKGRSKALAIAAAAGSEFSLSEENAQILGRIDSIRFDSI